MQACITLQKMKFSIKDFFSKCDQIRRFPADLVTFNEETLHGKPHFLCSVWHLNRYSGLQKTMESSDFHSEFQSAHI